MASRHFRVGLTSRDVRRVVYTFVFTFISSLVVNGAGVAQAKNYNEARAAAIALVVGGIAAGLSAVKNLFVAEESSLK